MLLQTHSCSPVFQSHREGTAFFWQTPWHLRDRRNRESSPMKGGRKLSGTGRANSGPSAWGGTLGILARKRVTPGARAAALESKLDAVRHLYELVSGFGREHGRGPKTRPACADFDGHLSANHEGIK